MKAQNQRLDTHGIESAPSQAKQESLTVNSSSLLIYIEFQCLDYWWRVATAQNTHLKYLDANLNILIC